MGNPPAPVEKATDQQLQRVPSARTIARLITTARDQLTKADTVTIAAIEGGVPPLVEARGLLDRFHTMVQQKSLGLDAWIVDATTSLLVSNGVSTGSGSTRFAPPSSAHH